MAVVVNTHNEQEEKVLLAFLNSLNYDYQTNNEIAPVSTELQQEVLERDHKFTEGHTTSKSWAEIKNNLSRVYR